MKTVLLSVWLLIPVLSQAQYVLIESNFYKLNQTQFGVYSAFHSGFTECYPDQARTEIVSNDTLFLKMVFETRVIVAAMPCDRTDTIEQTIIDSEIHFINVSTGIVTFDQNDPMLADTIWSIFDSTFAAELTLPEFSGNDLQLFCSQDQLTVKSPQTVQQLQVIDLNGKQLLTTNGNILDVSLLESGVYLLRVFTASGDVGTIRWFKE